VGTSSVDDRTVPPRHQAELQGETAVTVFRRPKVLLYAVPAAVQLLGGAEPHRRQRDGPPRQ